MYTEQKYKHNLVEADIIPDNDKIWQAISHQTSVILRDDVEGVQQSQQVLGVVWPSDGNMCTHTIFRNCGTHRYIP